MFVIYAQSNNKQFNFDPFLDIYAYLRMCDQCRSRSAGTSRLIRICTGRILIRNNLMNQKANSLDPDQTAQI